MIHFITSFDFSILHYFAQVRTLGGSYFFIDVSELGSIVVIGALAVCTGLLLALLRRIPDIAGLTLSVGGSFLVMEIMKLLIQRPRPSIHFAAFIENGYSFPSGHAMIGVAFYCFLAFLIAHILPRGVTRRVALYTLPALAFLISFGRVYLGVHYASDVVVGMILGGIIAGASIKLTLWLERRFYSEAESVVVTETFSEVRVVVSE